MSQESVPFKFVDLFAGLGGFHVALESLGGEAVFAAEWEPTLNALYQTNYGIRPWSDVNELATDEDIDRFIPGHDLLTAGFPCQPFSKAGEQLGFRHTSQGQLFFKVLQILKIKRPRAFILENVPNILRHDKGRTLQAICQQLGALGYDVSIQHLSPHEFGIPQVRDRAYFVGALGGLGGFAWPARHKKETSITKVLHDDVTPTHAIPSLTMRVIDMWGDFLKRTPPDLKLPSFPIWAMEFGATYPFEAETPASVWLRCPSRGLSGKGYRGSFGGQLDGLGIAGQKKQLPSHARRETELQFPRWKQNFIRQNRQFYADNFSWIDPWIEEWQPQGFASSFQKLEWNAQGEERDIDNFVLQIRASGVRVKRPKTAPSLIAFTNTQVPILGAHLAGERRYMTPRECAELQSLGDITLPTPDHIAYKALGNAVNAEVVRAIAKPLVAAVMTPPLALNIAVRH